MEKRTFATPLGEVWLWGDEEAFEGSKPLVFAILGAFNIESRWPDFIPTRLPEVAVVTAQLPGNFCPQPLTHSVGAYAAAYSRVLSQLGRPAIVLGASIGALVGMAMRAPNIRGTVALDPPLHTAKLWPLVGPFRERIASSPGEERLVEFLWNVFGVSAGTLEDRDYSDLVSRICVPTIVLAGEEALFPQRDLSSLPSLLDEADRKVFRAHPRVALQSVAGVGHSIVDGGYVAVLNAVRHLLETEFKSAEGQAAKRSL